MLDMGFLPAIRRILAVLPQHRQTLCFLGNDGAIGRAAWCTMPCGDPYASRSARCWKPVESVRLQAYEVAPGRKTDVLRQLLYAEKGRL